VRRRRPYAEPRDDGLISFRPGLAQPTVCTTAWGSPGVVDRPAPRPFKALARRHPITQTLPELKFKRRRHSTRRRPKRLTVIRQPVQNGDRTITKRIHRLRLMSKHIHLSSSLARIGIIQPIYAESNADAPNTWVTASTNGRAGGNFRRRAALRSTPKRAHARHLSRKSGDGGGVEPCLDPLAGRERSSLPCLRC
jgi:hypothetical protein